MRWLLACSCLVLTACQARVPAAEDAGFGSHLADAAAATTPLEGADSASRMTEIESKVEALRAQWQERLQNPDAPSRFFDPGAEGAPLLARARQADFAEGVAKELTLPQVLAGVFERNPRVKSARKTLAGTVEQYAQVTYLDTIQRQYVSFLRASRTGLGPTVPMDMLDKRFPFPGTLELKAALVRYAIQGAEARYDAAVRDAITEARTAYANYVFLGSAVRITRETLDVMKDLESSARALFESGRGGKAHLLQAQVEVAKLGTDLITLGQQRETARAKLAILMGLSPEAPLAEAAPVERGAYPADLAPAYELATKAQPDILIARAKEQRMATMIELAETTTYPDLSAGLAYMEDVSHATLGTGKEREPFSTKPKIKPDPWFGTKEAYLREVRERYRAAQEATRETSLRTRYKVKDAYVRLSTAKRVNELYRDVQVAQAEQAYRDASAGYTHGLVGYIDVADALRRWLQFRLEADRALRDYHVAHAALESAMGAPLSRLNDR